MTVKDGKLYNENNEVAVIHSVGYGAGWSTWNEYPESMFDPDIAQMILNKAPYQEIAELAESKWPDGYWSADHLTVSWVPSGTKFFIQEYDGLERIIYLNEVEIIA